jgi:hypothetical protein
MEVALSSSEAVNRQLDLRAVLELAARCNSGRLSESAWPAILGAGGAGVLPLGDGSWLMVGMDLRWSGPPPRSALDVDARLLRSPSRGPVPTALLQTTARVDGRALASVTFEVEMRHEPGPAQPPGASGPPPEGRSWSRTVTDDEVWAYCAALGMPWWSTATLDWAGLRSRPQPVVPVSLLTGEVIQSMPAGHHSLRARLLRPTLAGAALRFVATESRTWVLDPTGGPALMYEHDLDMSRTTEGGDA